MGMLKTFVILICVVIGSWLLFDGGRAIATGSYTTPQSGEYQGQLGPWTLIVKAVGLQPNSHLVKLVHLLLGVAWLATASLMAVNSSGSMRFALVTSLASIWYLPFGTLASIFTGVYAINNMRRSTAH